ncbi:hypothetical protein NUW54_g13546 [Trametes sanguinea]|uniref:Uncharacterized protein n=1 Tax=Trametes sanguinea TaxID=158606 RepID=A0ACC1MKS5_9APHY|nr:hypothetical protein NUW54_g13546 [Trametes sanguinea]
MDSSTLSSIPSLTTLHTSSSGLSSIPETPTNGRGVLRACFSERICLRRRRDAQEEVGRDEAVTDVPAPVHVLAVVLDIVWIGERELRHELSRERIPVHPAHL